MRFLCFLPILGFLLVFCHSDNGSIKELYGERGPVPRDQNENQFVVMTPQESEDSVSGGSSEVLELFDGVMDCPHCLPSLGYLIKTDILDQNPQEEISLTDFCQGRLLQEDVFLVSFHCLPESVQSVGDSCINEVQVILPQIDDDRPMKLLRCEQIIALPSTEITLLNNDFELDWVALRLKDRASERF